MKWFLKRRVQSFVDNPDAYLVVNPRFCDHEFPTGTPCISRCQKCGLLKSDWMKQNPYNL